MQAHKGHTMDTWGTLSTLKSQMGGHMDAHIRPYIHFMCVYVSPNMNALSVMIDIIYLLVLRCENH